jgi:hypothetical protein
LKIGVLKLNQNDIKIIKKEVYNLLNTITKVGGYNQFKKPKLR